MCSLYEKIKESFLTKGQCEVYKSPPAGQVCPFAGGNFPARTAAVCAAVFTDEQLTKLVNFGAITSFVMLNFAVFWFFFIREGRRGLADTWRYLVCPAVGMAILLYVWSGFDHMTQYIGFGWLAVGLVIGYVKSKGYKEVPEAFKRKML